jgi:cytoplasmic iron level regulating protein YaaA (DUF328/UPF0246 family)
MLTVLSPAKTLDFETQSGTTTHSIPDFLDNTSELISVLRQQSPGQLKKLMKISDLLANLNAQRYQDWTLPLTMDNARQAILAFKGDVYLGLQADTFSQRDLNFAQKHLRILSGLYGVLKPLDLIQPYRLEMSTKLETSAGKNLYQFWGDSLTRKIEADLKGQRSKVLINLASNEYFKSLQTGKPGFKVINPVFKDYNNGSYKVLGFFAKKARGLMANYIIKNRVNQAEDLKSFNSDGYRFNKTLSNENNWVYTRKPS